MHFWKQYESLSPANSSASIGDRRILPPQNQRRVSPEIRPQALRDRIRTVAVSPGASIASVALESDFADQAHLQRAFKRHVAATPGQYRG
jgi:AraC-like DNA-binding protein